MRDFYPIVGWNIGFGKTVSRKYLIINRSCHYDFGQNLFTFINFFEEQLLYHFEKMDLLRKLRMVNINNGINLRHHENDLFLIILIEGTNELGNIQKLKKKV